MKRFIRMQYDFGITLKKMQQKAEKEFGLCCYRLEDKDKLYNEFIPQVCDEGEEIEIIIFEGEIWGLCPEGYKVMPSKIIDRKKYIYRRR